MGVHFIYTDIKYVHTKAKEPIKMNNKLLGEFIALLRKEKGLTQKQFAEILSVSDKTVSHWECDETSPDISLLPLIADTFGITVDELLRGEKDTSHTENQTYTLHPPELNNSRFFAFFKAQSIIVSAISLIALIVSVGVRELLTYFVFTQTANTFSCSIIVCGALIAVVCALIFAVNLKNKLKDTNDKNDLLFKCLRITSLNIYLSLICVSLFLSFYARGRYIYLLICIAILTVAELIVGKKLSVYSGKEKLYVLRRNMIILLYVLILCGGVLQFCAIEIYHPHPENIVFYSAEEFRKFMETPKEKPPKAYLVDQQEMTTMMHTDLFTENHEETDTDIETVFDDLGNEIISFRYLNKEVYDFSYNSEQGTFHIITYQEKIKTQNIQDFCNSTLNGIMVAYYLTAFAVIVVTYKKKKSKL